MLWEIEIRPVSTEVDRDAAGVLGQCRILGANSVRAVSAARTFLVEGDLSREAAESLARTFFADPVVETFRVVELPDREPEPAGQVQLNVLCLPGVTDNVAESVRNALVGLGHPVRAVRTGRKYWLNADIPADEMQRVQAKVLFNQAIQQIIKGPLGWSTLALGGTYNFAPVIWPILNATDEELTGLSLKHQLSLNLVEMKTIQAHFAELGREPTDAELETVAQTWSEHCSHKTLGGRVHYVDESRDVRYTSMLKETIFAATRTIRANLGANDWCVSVFKDNAGIVQFDDEQHVCIKVETHNRPSALEPYGGANTGLGGVIRDSLGTGLGAKPIANTNVFCFAPPDTPYSALPEGVLHPRVVMTGVVSGVRDYGNRMGIPTVNGALFFDDRYIGNPLVFCGNVATIPVDKVEKAVQPGDLIVSIGGRTGRDGIHGATFSSVELTEKSEKVSGGAVQIGDAITEKMLMDVLLQARDRRLYHAVTDCGAGGFSSAVGEMGAESGAEVWLDRAPLKYSGLTYTEIWISEAQERMVLAVPPEHWAEFHALCAAEGVEASTLGTFTNTGRLVLKYQDHIVADLAMSFLHDGRPPVVREARYQPPAVQPLSVASTSTTDFTGDLRAILGSLNVCSKEWVIRQYDHEVQAGSVVKPLVGACEEGPSDAAVVRPNLGSWKALAISNGMNPRYGDFDPYWMAASAIDEAVRNCVAVGADPSRIAILDNFCWGKTDRPETLGSLVRAAIGCQEIAIAYGTPFISGKDSLNNEFLYKRDGEQKVISIPGSLLISALGIVPDLRRCVTMDLKRPGNKLFLVGATKNELGGSHWSLVRGLTGGEVPRVDVALAPKMFTAMHRAISAGRIRACHDLSEGGLAVALAEMCFAGEFGARVSLGALSAQVGATADPAWLLFAESNTRFVVEVTPENVAVLREAFAGLPLVELGEVTSAPDFIVTDGGDREVIRAAWADLKECWQKPLRW